MTIVLQSLIIFLSSSVQGAIGFGFSLLALPLLGLLLPMKSTVPSLVVLSTLMNVIILFRLRTKPKLRPLVLVFLMSVLFTPVGVQMLAFMDERILKISLGVVLVAIAIAMKKGYRFDFKRKWIAYSIAGILSGIMNGAASLSGPPIVVLLTNENQDKNVFRSSLTSMFLMLNCVTLYLYHKSGILNVSQHLEWVPMLILGTVFGTVLGSRIDELKFRKLVLNLLIIMGVMNLF